MCVLHGKVGITFSALERYEVVGAECAVGAVEEDDRIVKNEINLKE